MSVASSSSSSSSSPRVDGRVYNASETSCTTSYNSSNNSDNSSSNDEAEDNNNDNEISYATNETANTLRDDYKVTTFRYLNYPSISLLKHRDVAFLLVVDTLFLSLLGYKNDHVVRNNISPSSKFKPNDVLARHSYDEKVWLLDKTGLRQLIAATNNPKIMQFKMWIKRVILREQTSSSSSSLSPSSSLQSLSFSNPKIDAETQPSSTPPPPPPSTPTPTPRTRRNISKPIDIPQEFNDKLYLIRRNNRFHLVDRVHDCCSLDMLYCWRHITPDMRSRFTVVHEDAINIIYNSSAGDFFKALMYVEHILYRATTTVD